MRPIDVAENATIKQLQKSLAKLSEDHRRLIDHVNALGDTVNKVIRREAGISALGELEQRIDQPDNC